MSKKDLAVRPAEVPAFYQDLDPAAGRATDDQDLLSPPYLRVAQALSSQDGAVAGEFYSDHHNRSLGKTIQLVPIKAQIGYKCWSEDRRLLWSTVNRSDPRVAVTGPDGRDMSWQFRCIDMLVLAPWSDANEMAPLIWSFSSTHFNAGRNFYQEAFRNERVPAQGQLFEATTYELVKPKGTSFAPKIRFKAFLSEDDYAISSAAIKQFATVDLIREFGDV